MANPIHVSEAASIALHAMMLLAAAPAGKRTTGQIAATLRVSEAHLSKVLQRLTRVGLVIAVRGPKGGFRIGPDPAAISLLDVYQAIEGPYTDLHCLLEKPVCGGQCCVLGGLLRALEALRPRMAETTLKRAAASWGTCHEAPAA